MWSSGNPMGCFQFLPLECSKAYKTVPNCRQKKKIDFHAVHSWTDPSLFRSFYFLKLSGPFFGVKFLCLSLSCLALFTKLTSLPFLLSFIIYISYSSLLEESSTAAHEQGVVDFCTSNNDYTLTLWKWFFFLYKYNK